MIYRDPLELLSEVEIVSQPWFSEAITAVWFARMIEAGWQCRYGENGILFEDQHQFPPATINAQQAWQLTRIYWKTLEIPTLDTLQEVLRKKPVNPA